MIGTIDVKIQAHNPNFPLEPVFTFINSAQSFRIRNVPRAIGKWNITKVFVRLAYPDNTTVQKECVLNGNIWIGTVEGCATSGTSTNGFIVTASGIDENENIITNYVLGAGDLYVKDLDGTIDPDRTGQKMYFNDTLPANPKKGDATFIDQTLNIYDGTNWVPVAVSPDPSFIIDADGSKIEADRTVTYASGYTPWQLEQFYTDTYDPPVTMPFQTIVIDGNEMNCWITQNAVQIPPNMSQNYVAINEDMTIIYLLTKEGDTYHDDGNMRITEKSDFEITNTNQVSVLFTRSKIYTTGELAILDDIPTSFDYIADADGNRIDADGDFTYIDSSKWSVDLGQYGEYVLSTIQTEEWTYAEAEGIDGNKKVVLKWVDNMQVWELSYYQWQEAMFGWHLLSQGQTYDSHQATSLEIDITGDFSMTAECRKGAPSTDKLVTEGYVNGIVGNINSVLDSINGEVI